MPPFTTDQHGVPLTGSPEAAAGYNRALDRLLRFRPEVIAETEQLRAHHPEAAMGHALEAYLNLMGTNPADLPAAAMAAASLAQTAAHPRERGHLAAVESWLAGDWRSAAAVLDDVLEQWPADLLALAVGHQLDFFLGDAPNLRDRIGRSLPTLDPGSPSTGLVRGMHAFGLEESGHYGPAEEAGLTALEVNPDDVWALHAVVHTYEMQGLADAGTHFLQHREADWGAGNLFAVHNWWHLALFALEAGQRTAALTIYDNQIRHSAGAGVPIELLDASALLWRFLLDEADTDQRFDALAAAWEPTVARDPWYAFNDAHLVMALAGAGRTQEASALIERLRIYGREARGTNAMMTAQIGVPVCAALLAFVQGRYSDVIADLHPIRPVLHLFGGSHAQRDAVQRTLVEAALRSNRPSLAAALTAERISRRERSSYNWSVRARALRNQGRADAAAAADLQAADHLQRFAQAWAP
jgi:tetratricopeptide (TPR) repeat protein